ncbi:hypothetical protein PSA7680_00491 [Pseudoruegeria aquimaris]|uniref:Acetolactate synthase n=1 Tax=Pseudoruegeria aquimaris TaxID=393663 RepID=A0A1Y5RG45_9RHOB|nr:DUF6497 family protein [Pseudoruegeria aquimaris]SLN16745.1 hypothetical protein PSA7680_00491 [Pseudoruegeria aquimaris]
MRPTLRTAFSALALAALLAPAVSSEAIAVPSGQPVTFHDMIWGEPGPAGLTMRFRFIAPLIADGEAQVGFDEAEADMAFLCESYALPRLADQGPGVSQIIISLSDRPVPFGEMAPDVVQFFEAYRPEGSSCVWDGF